MTLAQTVQEWVLAQQGITVYAGLFAMLFLGVFGLPLPEDLPLILGGILMQLGKCEPLTTFLVCYGAIIIGDLIIFGTGRYFGPKLFRMRWFSSRAAKTKLKRIRVGLERRSILMVFLARHLFYIRTLTFLSCGALNMRPMRFLIADLIAGLISVPAMLALGYFAAEHYDAAMRILNDFKMGGLLVAVVIVGVLTWWYRRESKAAHAENAASPGTPSE